MLQSSPDLCGITTKNKSSLLVYNHIHTHINTLIQVSLPFKLPLLWAYFFTSVMASRIQREMVT